MRLTDGRPMYKQVVRGIIQSVFVILCAGTIAFTGLVIYIAATGNHEIMVAWLQAMSAIVCIFSLYSIYDWASK